MTYFVYDLETTGLSASWDRIIQFGGVRCDEDFQPVGDPVDFLVKLAPDVIPQPQAILSNRILPLAANLNGLNEADLLVELQATVFCPDTVLVGYNSVDFDDNFIRHLCYRNFADPFAWQRTEGRGSWDLWPVVSLASDLRPEGINWPRGSGDRRSLKLGDLARANDLRQPTHQTLTDVWATIDLANLIRQKQPKLFDYLLSTRSAEDISRQLQTGQPLVSGGHYYPDSDLRTTVIQLLGEDPVYRSNFIVYDLRVDPSPYVGLDPADLKTHLTPEALRRGPFWRLAPGKGRPLAPLSVIGDSKIWQRLKLDKTAIDRHRKILDQSRLGQQLAGAFEAPATPPALNYQTVDGYLYFGGPIDKADADLMDQAREARPPQLADLDLKFADPRLNLLFPLYKARNWPGQLSSADRTVFDDYVRARFQSGAYNLTKFGRDLERLSRVHTDADDQEILRELSAYIQAQLPTVMADDQGDVS